MPEFKRQLARTKGDVACFRCYIAGSFVGEFDTTVFLREIKRDYGHEWVNPQLDLGAPDEHGGRMLVVHIERA